MITLQLQEQLKEIYRKLDISAGKVMSASKVIFWASTHFQVLAHRVLYLLRTSPSCELVDSECTNNLACNDYIWLELGEGRDEENNFAFISKSWFRLHIVCIYLCSSKLFNKIMWSKKLLKNKNTIFI